MTIQKYDKDKDAIACEIAIAQQCAVTSQKYPSITSQKYPNITSTHNAVTVPADKLAELQRKAKLVDELVYVLEDVSEFLDFAWRDIEMNDYSFTLLEEVICKVQRQIAKAKGE